MNRHDRRKILKEVKMGGTPLDNVEGIYFAAQNFRQRARDLYEEYMISGGGVNIDSAARQMMSLYDLTYSETNPEWTHIANTFKKFKARHPILMEWLAIAYWYMGDYQQAQDVHREARKLDQSENFLWIKENDKWFLSMQTSDASDSLEAYVQDVSVHDISVSEEPSLVETIFESVEEKI
jgi:tetratricopeptide (TPR) repeat protein